MASAGKEGLIVDTDTGLLRENHVLVQRAAGAVLVLGFGPRAERLRNFACDDEDGDADEPFLERCREAAQTIENGPFAKALQSGFPRSVLKIEDPLLRRLAIAEALAKASFNPDEPRDERGRWTREGNAPPLIEGRSVATAIAGGFRSG